MKSPPFEYVAPRSVDEAVALLREHGDEAKVLAGGQSLIPILALRLAHPAVLVDIGGIDTLGEIAGNGMLTIGASVTQRRAERAPAVASASRAARRGAAVDRPSSDTQPGHRRWQHRPRRPGRRVARGHAGPRRADDDPRRRRHSHRCGDRLLPLVSRDRDRARRVAHRRARADCRRSVSGSSFQEISRRHGDFALAGAATQLELDADGRVRSARIAFCGVASTPVRADAATDALVGRVLDESTIAEIAACRGRPRSAVGRPRDRRVPQTHRRRAGVSNIDRCRACAARPARLKPGARAAHQSGEPGARAAHQSGEPGARAAHQSGESSQ